MQDRKPRFVRGFLLPDILDRIEVLAEYFAARGQPTPPVAVKSVWEHTAAVAKAERQAITEVAMETMLCAINPDGGLPHLGGRVLLRPLVWFLSVVDAWAGLRDSHDYSKYSE